MRKATQRGLKGRGEAPQKGPKSVARTKKPRRPRQPDKIDYWAVVKSKPRQERYAAKQLLMQGFEAWCPMQRVPNTRWRQEPMFPGYLFCRITGPFYAIQSTYGVAGMIMSGERPSPVPKSVMTGLRKFEKEQMGGTLEQRKRRAKFSPGERALVEWGYLAGQLVIYEKPTAADRVRVLLQFMGKQVAAELRRDQLKKVENASP